MRCKVGFSAKRYARTYIEQVIVVYVIPCFFLQVSFDFGTNLFYWTVRSCTGFVTQIDMIEFLVNVTFTEYVWIAPIVADPMCLQSRTLINSFAFKWARRNFNSISIINIEIKLQSFICHSRITLSLSCGVTPSG